MKFIKELLEEFSNLSEAFPPRKPGMQGHVLVVNNKIVARNSKKSLTRKAKNEYGGLASGKVFIAYTGKEVGDTWEKDTSTVITESEIAKTILQQLGGNKFAAMTGAKKFMALDDGKSLFMTIGKNSSRANAMKVTLEPSDTYTMRFYQMRKGQLNELEKYEDVYWEDLQRLFTKYTGMYTSL